MDASISVLQQDAETIGKSVEKTDLKTMVCHREAVDSSSQMADVYKAFQSGSGDYMAVLDCGQVVGICSRAHVGFLMGHRYGNAIYASHRISEHMIEKPLILRDGTPLREVLERALGREGKEFHDDVALIGHEDEFLGMITVQMLVRMQSSLVAERFQAQELLRRRLVAVSRQAGMAEVATGVLHNVGNVLNSVNVSATLVRDLVHQSRISVLEKVGTAMEKHSQNLADYLTIDPKGRLIPELLQQLCPRLRVEQSKQLQELDLLVKHIGHIKSIVAMQQSYAKVSGISETISAKELVEDALEMNAEAFVRHAVLVVREFQAVHSVVVDRHKVLQILTNLLRNAKYALDQNGTADKRITIRIGPMANQRVRIVVADNGIGIAPENLTRIFSHGFTTKKEGHGFGLHSAALAAKEMGGSLAAHSDGTGKGAVFTLELPTEKTTT